MALLNDRYGSWALIVGAETAVGAEFARQIASEGVNLVLCAPSAGDLERLPSELRGDHEVEVRVLGGDLRQPDFLTRLRGATHDIDVGILVSITGLWFPGGFVENDLEDDDKIVELNLDASIRLVEHFGRKMAERGRGGILVVSSPVLAQPTFLGQERDLALSHELPIAEALWYELSPHGIDVLGVTLDPELGSGGSSPAASRAVTEALSTLGQATSRVPGRMTTTMNLMGTWIFSRDPGDRTAGALVHRAAHRILN